MSKSRFRKILFRVRTYVCVWITQYTRYKSEFGMCKKRKQTKAQCIISIAGSPNDHESFAKFMNRLLGQTKSRYKNKFVAHRALSDVCKFTALMVMMMSKRIHTAHMCLSCAYFTSHKELVSDVM